MTLAMLVLACCLNAPLDVTVNTDTIAAGAILPLPAADSRSSVSLGYAPKPGLARRIPRHEILAKIQAAGFRVDDLHLPEAILVRRHAESLQAEQVRQAVLDAFNKQFPDARIELLSVETPSVSLASGDMTISGSLPARFDPNAPVFVRIDVRGPGASRTLFARTVVRIEAVQPVLRVRIPANSEIRPDDVEWRHAPLESGGVVQASLDGVQGMLAKRDLEPGQVVRADLLYTPLYVRKGESVTVKATSRGVTIAATMRAMAQGRLGDTIPVQHLNGGGGTTARVIGPRTLEAIQR